MGNTLPSIPAKRYFTIGEVAELCGVKPHVLRYWEQEFTQLRPMKRRGNRRYYQHHEVLMIRRIRDLLYEQGFTINGARNKLQELAQGARDKQHSEEDSSADVNVDLNISSFERPKHDVMQDYEMTATQQLWAVRQELFEIRHLLSEVPQAQAII